MSVIEGQTENTQNTENSWQLPDTVATTVKDEGNGLAGALTAESPDDKWEYLALYERQNKVAEQLNQRAKENDKKDKNWNVLCFKPEELEFDGDMVIYGGCFAFKKPYLFSIENETFKEIPILPNETYLDGQWNWVIPVTIEKKADGVYEVSFAYIRNHTVCDRWNFSYYIDKSWKKIEKIWKIWKFKTSDGHICSNNIDTNHWWFRYAKLTNYDPQKETQSTSLTIFDENFNTLYTIENSQQYTMKYCDEVVCILENSEGNNQGQYMLIVNWKDQLDKNELLDKFLAEEAENKRKQEEADKERRARNKIPFWERFKHINHCIILPNNEEHKLTITNDKEGEDKKTLIEISDFSKLNEDNNTPSIVTKDWYFRIENRNDDSDILFLKKYDKEGNVKGSVFINKNTWEDLKFDWLSWRLSFLRWKLIEVFYTWSDSEIYDQNLEKVWKKFWSTGEDNGLFGIAVTDENWNEKGCLYNASTLENLWEIEIEDKKFFWEVIKRTYSDDKGNHYIIRKKDGTLIEVSI